MEIYLHFLPFLNSDLTEIIEIIQMSKASTRLRFEYNNIICPDDLARPGSAVSGAAILILFSGVF